MDWREIAGDLVKAGAPIIGGALGGPLGGMIGSAIGNVVATALGVDSTPEAVNDALKTTPADQLQAKLSAAESEAVAKWPALADMVKAESELGQKQVSEIGDTMRAELLASNNIVGPWRTFIAVIQSTWRPAAMFVWVGSWPFQLYTVLNHAYVRDAATLAELSSLLYALAVWNAGPAGLAGVYAWGRTREKLSDLVPLPGPAKTVIDTVKKLVGKK